jgi:hypothetical protein
MLFPELKWSCVFVWFGLAVLVFTCALTLKLSHMDEVCNDNAELSWRFISEAAQKPQTWLHSWNAESIPNLWPHFHQNRSTFYKIRGSGHLFNLPSHLNMNTCPFFSYRSTMLFSHFPAGSCFLCWVKLYQTTKNAVPCKLLND